MANYRYGPYDDGPDPLAAPYDVREALDEMGERILGGDNTRDALFAAFPRTAAMEPAPTGHKDKNETRHIERTRGSTGAAHG